MKFTGELKFPEIDHPGVPVHFVIEGTQAELLVDGESLGRWSLYDVRARRLVASAFQIDLDGTEVTFVADDPIDFAYRGVEHMAETWATLKSKRIASRSIAVRKSRRGANSSRIEDMKMAMLSNLEDQSAPRQLAGEVVMPGSRAPSHSETTGEEPGSEDWDRRDEAGAIPMIGQEEEGPDPDSPSSSEDLQWIEDEKRRLAEERAQLEEERRLAERREEDRVEAFRLEMERLRAEREELQRKAAGPTDAVEPVEPEMADEVEPVEPVEPEMTEPPAAEDEPDEPEAEEPEAEEPVPGLVDLNDLEHDFPEPRSEPEAPVGVAPVPSTPAPEPTAAASTGRERSGLMGAVRAAFRAGSKDHDHQFIEAPGGIGITRYVCEECGYVSISA